MSRFARALFECLREAWDGLWRHPAFSLLSAGSIGVALYVLGLFLLLAFNLDRFVDALGREAQVQIYLRDAARPEEIAALRQELATDPAVASARLIDRDEAARRFAVAFPALRDVTEGLEQNPFAASFEIEVSPGYRDAPALERLAMSYRKAPGVEDVRYDPGWVQRLAGLVALVRGGGYGLGLLLAGAALATVAAVVRLTVLARHEEIEIMKLVGATAWFIRLPLVVGAAAQGLLGGALAVGGLALTHHLLTRSMFYRANPFMALLAGGFIPAGAAAALALGGASLGVVAALLSLRRAGTY